MPVDYASIGIAVVIAIVIFALVYFFGIKDDTIATNITTIQSSINTLNAQLSGQNTTITGLNKKITDVQATINTAIDNLAGLVKTNNTDSLKLINDLKTANENLTKSTTGSAKTLQDNINTLQTKLNDFIIESNRTDEKQNSQIATLTNKLRELDERESKETSALIKKLGELDTRESDETTKLKKMVDDLIAQDKVNFDTLEKRFPELKDTIDEIKRDSDKKIKVLQADLDKNTDDDKKYNTYVDTINDYISNALSLPDISDKVKKMIFGNKDMVLEMYKLDPASAVEYVYDQYYGVMGCPWTKERITDPKRPMTNLWNSQDECVKKIKNGIDVEKCHDYIFLLHATMLRTVDGGAVTLDMNSMKLVVSKKAEGELERAFNQFLPKLNFKPISKDADGVLSYPYSEARAASKKAVEMLLLKDCSGLFQEQGCKYFNEAISKSNICYPPVVATATAPQPVQQVATISNQQVATATAPQPVQQVATISNQQVATAATISNQQNPNAVLQPNIDLVDISGDWIIINDGNQGLAKITAGENKTTWNLALTPLPGNQLPVGLNQIKYVTSRGYSYNNKPHAIFTDSKYTKLVANYPSTDYSFERVQAFIANEKAKPQISNALLAQEANKILIAEQVQKITRVV